MTLSVTLDDGANANDASLDAEPPVDLNSSDPSGADDIGATVDIDPESNEIEMEVGEDETRAFVAIRLS